MSKITHLDTYISKPDKQTVLVGGCFDIIHVGHIRFLKAAKQEGDWLIVALESDEFINTFKHREPFNTVSERTEILSALSSVDEIIILPLLQSDEEYVELVKKVHPSIIALTEGDPYMKHKEQQAQRVNAEVKVVISLVPGKSTTEMLKLDPIKDNSL